MAAGIPSCYILFYSAISLARTPAQDVSPGPESYWGRPVVRVRLDCDASLTLKDFPGRVTQGAGEPLDRSKVQESLKNLFASGRFRDLSADVSPLDPGVELVFVARAAYFVGFVRVEGVRDPLDPGILVTASGLRLGQKFDDADLEGARERLSGVLKENAYYGASIHYRVTPDPQTQAAEILFSVTPGKPARLHSIEFHGDLEVPIQKLTSISGWKVRAQLTSVRLERGLFKIHQLYLNRGYPQALTTILARELNPQNNAETLAIQIVAGPLVRVRLEGAKVSKSKLRSILPFDREGSLDKTGIELGAKSLKDYFEGRGYYGAKVNGRSEKSTDSRALEIVYHVELGESGALEGFEFRGNHHVPEDELRAAVSLEPRDFFRKQGRFSRGILDGDVSNLRAVYGRHGYPDAEIRPEVLENYEGRRGSVYVVFQIDVGFRTTIGRLDLEGASHEAVNEMWPGLLSKPGRAFSPVNAQIDRETITRYYADRGYVSVAVRFETAPAPHPGELNLIYHIDPGTEEHIKRVVVLGREYTRAGTISREVVLKEGNPLRQTDVLETQRRLYDLGVLSQVQIASEDPGSEETDQTVLVGLEEAKRWTVGYGGGIEFQRLGSNNPQGEFQVSPRLSLEVSRLNVGGRAQTVSLRGRFSSIDKGGAISYLIPRFPTHRDLSLNITALAERSREVVTFTSLRREILLSLEKRFSPSAFLATRFSFRKVKALDFPQGTEQQIPIASRDARVAMLGLSYGVDKRDEPTDATHGSYSLADAGVSWKAFGSESNFVRLAVQNATYYRISPHLVFARSTRLAVESTVGSVTTAGAIPLPERFFLGGSESHRGFSINQAGPRDPIDGFPLGGEALFFNSLELRVRLANDRLGIVFFQDAGNVFSEVKRMKLLKFTQSSPLDLDFNSLAAGMGMRYKTPVGPFRVDVGYNFNPPRYQVIPDGTPNGIPDIRRLPRFQIFVGIGQSF
jgi:outer membrane protein assembly complex protein YaeT